MSSEVDGSFAHPVRTSGPWSAWFRGWYRVLRLVERPLVALALGRGFGNLVVLAVAGRRSGRMYRTPLGLLRANGQRYIGHPSGDTGWTLNLRAANVVELETAGGGTQRVRATVLEMGTERDAVVQASFSQHPFPGSAMYRLAGRHVAASGVFFRLTGPEDVEVPEPGADAGTG